ncbi:MAG TPA: DUF6526 family protein [Flavisolibacter sp.]|nr:DUF6526 family protein [Flavisolibacter sp.]
MPEQNYKNHRRLIIPFHVLTLLAIIALLIGSIRNVIYYKGENVYSAWLLVLVALILLSLFFFIRSFPIKAQDRAIRAEESLRYYILTGKRLDPRLTIGQIIALRFASDEELPSLVIKAVDEHLSNDAIKKEIKNWRSDTHRA